MPVTADSVVDPQAVFSTVLFRSRDLTVTRHEVRCWADRFDPHVAARAEARAALAALDVSDEQLDAEVEAVAAEFRYARGLEAAAEFTAWLGARGLSLDAWWEAMRRDVLEQRLGEDEVDETDEDEEADEDTNVDSDDDADAAARVAELVVSDLLSSATKALARRVAVAREAMLDLPPSIDERHGVLEDVWNRWRATLTSETQLNAAVDRERLSWMVLDLVRTRWQTPDAAHEAIVCVRDDGIPLEEVARSAHALCLASTVLLAQLPEPLRDALLTAAPGELVGPIEMPSHFEVVWVRAKRAATLAEPLVRAAAVRNVEARAAEPLVTRHIDWAEDPA